jgi:hypothetical protein
MPCVMDDQVATALTRIDHALSRIEQTARAVSQTRTDGRYERLRERTQAALSQLDSVIARMAREDAR